MYPFVPFLLPTCKKAGVEDGRSCTSSRKMIPPINRGSRSPSGLMLCFCSCLFNKQNSVTRSRGGQASISL